MITIAHIIGGPMNVGGVESFLMNMFDELNKNMFSFNFVCNTREEGIWDKKISQLGGKVFNINFKDNFINTAILESAFNTYYKFFKNHKEFDIVHIHSYSASRYFIAKAAKKAGIKNIIFHMHNTNCGNKFANKIGRNYLLKNDIKLLACGEAASMWGYGKLVEIMHNAININNFMFKVDDRKKIREEMGIAGDDIVIGAVGRVDYIKNHKFLLNIADRIKRKKKIIIVGDGCLKEELETFVEENDINDIIFTGLKNDINEILNAFDVFVLPSIHEGLPVTAIEAQANGLICIFSSEVSREADICGNSLFISLDDEQEWIDTLNNIDVKRQNYNNVMTEKGYNLEKEIKHLEKIYFDMEG